MSTTTSGTMTCSRLSESTFLQNDHCTQHCRLPTSESRTSKPKLCLCSIAASKKLRHEICKSFRSLKNTLNVNVGWSALKSGQSTTPSIQGRKLQCHLRSKKRQFVISLLKLSTQSTCRLKNPKKCNTLSRIDLKANLTTSTITLLTAWSSRDLRRFGSSRRTECSRRRDETKKPSRLWTSGHKRDHVWSVSSRGKRNTWTSQRILSKLGASLGPTGNPRISTPKTTPLNSIRQLTKARSRLNKRVKAIGTSRRKSK